jgi:Leucine-rich repeat (LRR) protein
MLTLPRDIVRHLSRYLNFWDLTAIRSTCSYLHRCAVIKSMHAVLWRSYKLTDNILAMYPHLTELYAGGNPSITNEGLKQLPILITLDVYKNTKITNEGLKHLPHLTELNANGSSSITDEGLKYLPRLTSLFASGNPGITDAAAVRLRIVTH